MLTAKSSATVAGKVFEINGMAERELDVRDDADDIASMTDAEQKVKTSLNDSSLPEVDNKMASKAQISSVNHYAT